VRAVIQRVTEARVTVGREVVGEIGSGLCVLLGVDKQDGEENATALADKIKNLRVFEDPQGKMNRSITDTGGELLVVSQFTLYADCRKGNRPSFSDAAPAAEAESLYQFFVQRLRDTGLKVATGSFQAHMKVSLVNDGPVTFILEN
jgi:D-tyrosyl-tRNA(Tyr) deacylase